MFLCRQRCVYREIAMNKYMQFRELEFIVLHILLHSNYNEITKTHLNDVSMQ